MKVEFTKDYDHKWPSGCVTAFKAGWSGVVKREAGEAAVARHAAKEVKVEVKDAKPDID